MFWNDIYYLDFIIYFISICVLCIFMLLCGYCLGGRSYSRSKNLPFESGVISLGNSRLKFSMKFYLIAMVFVIFDVEGLYLYIWSVSIREIGWIGFFEVCVFLFVLLISLVYLVRIGSFDWIQKPFRYGNCINCFNYFGIHNINFVNKMVDDEIHFNTRENGSK